MHTRFFKAICLSAGLLTVSAAAVSAGSGIPGRSYDPNGATFFSQDEPVFSPRRNACQRARQAVEDRGYTRVSVLECKGKHYSFSGYRDGAWWKIKVRARNGKVRRAYKL